MCSLTSGGVMYALKSFTFSSRQTIFSFLLCVSSVVKTLTAIVHLRPNCLACIFRLCQLSAGLRTTVSIRPWEGDCFPCPRLKPLAFCTPGVELNRFARAFDSELQWVSRELLMSLHPASVTLLTLPRVRKL